MKAVCDTSPLCFLVVIGEVEIVPALFDEIFIPKAVETELRHPKAPEVVRNWISAPPDWLSIRSVGSSEEPRMRTLHVGEREAILLVRDLAADWLVVDELAARRVAKSLNLRFTGLLARKIHEGSGQRGRNPVKSPYVNRLRENQPRSPPWQSVSHKRSFRSTPNCRS